MSVKTIKDVDERTWSEIKSLSARHGMNMGKMLHIMVENYSQKSDEFWDAILSHDVLLSAKEERGLLDSVKKIRNEYGFRR